MSHVDYVGALPEGFVSIAHTDHCPVAAMQNLEKRCSASSITRR